MAKSLQSFGFDLPQISPTEEDHELKTINDNLLKPFDLLLGWITQDKPRKLGKKIHPGYFPKLDGTRYQVERKHDRWQQDLLDCYVVSERPRGLPEIRVRTMRGGNGWLAPTVIKELLTEGWINDLGQFNFEKKKTSKTKGRHLVIPLTKLPCPVHLKVFPEMPGMEFAASSFTRFATGTGLPFVEIGRSEVGTNIYPLIFSEEIEGEDLDQEMCKDKSPRVDKRTFTIAFLLTLLLNPEDQKPDNIVKALNNLLKLWLVDNDRSFYAVTDEVWSIKSIIYCLDQMKETLDQSVIEEFLSVEPFLVLSRWLQELASAETALANLFTKKEIEALYNESIFSTLKKKTGFKQDLPETSLIPIPIREKMLAELYIKMVRIQEVLAPKVKQENDDNNEDDDSTELTAIEILKIIEPILGQQYGELLEQYPDAASRFDAGPGKEYEKGNKDVHQTPRTIPQTLESMHGKAVSLKELQQREQFIATQATAELRETRAKYQKIQSIAEAITNGEDAALKELEAMTIDNLREKIINRLDFSKIKDPAKVFRAMENMNFQCLRLDKLPDIHETIRKNPKKIKTFKRINSKRYATN